ncbi:MAG: FliM/FliN family flagellar motor switch protein, partial [Syntrophales bacterium]|nr:FliM/FliN family flagellar motor switch protein [Syntrophales bacterium]
PQFAQVVPLTDVVVVVNFELEVEYNTGILSVCIPYSTLEPLKERLQAGFQSEQLEVDHVWTDKFRSSLKSSQIEVLAELGRAKIHGKDLVSMKKGDIIPLEQYASDALNVYVQGVLKFRGAPGLFKGNQAVQISQIITGKEVVEYGTE